MHHVSPSHLTRHIPHNLLIPSPNPLLLNQSNETRHGLLLALSQKPRYVLSFFLGDALQTFGIRKSNCFAKMTLYILSDFFESNVAPAIVPP
jgi:hypothetical protein